MNKLIAILIASILAFATSYNYAQASFNCGMKPIKPIGCSSQAECRCDSDGNCRWVFIC